MPSSATQARALSRPALQFVIFAPPYDPDVGGYIALHYLCHLLNELGHPAFLVPRFWSAEISPLDSEERLKALMAQREAIRQQPFVINPAWNTPIYRKPWRGIAQRTDTVVVYPESEFGNPLRGRHVARWLLHDPGFHQKEVYFVPGEVHFRYLEMHQPVRMPWIEVVDTLLTVSHIPWEHYHPPAEGAQRSGTAYLLRKSRHRPLVHEVEGSIKVDGMSHAQIGEICRQVRTFISYDTRTLYSHLAALAGADSIVVPEDGVSVEAWQPDPALRAGVAYGFDDLAAARASQPVVRDTLQKLADRSRHSVAGFAAFWQTRLLGG